MKRLFFVFLVVGLINQNRGQHFYNKSQFTYPVKRVSANVNAIQFGTQVIKGHNEKNYEVTISPAKKTSHEKVLIVQHVNQPIMATTAYQTQQPNLYIAPVKKEVNGNFQQGFHNQQQNNRNFVVQSPQNFYNQIPANSYYLQHLQHLLLQEQQHPQTQAIINLQRAQRQIMEGTQQQQQQQFATVSQTTQQPQQNFAQPSGHYLPPPVNNNYLPNSNNLLNDLINNQKYVSQSEASQLDVYPYIQMNGNPRPFTRIITICDASGHCVPQNTVANGGNDYQHQQVLQQSKAQIVSTPENFQNKINYQMGENSLTDDASKAQTVIPTYKGTDLKPRRHFRYCEIVVPQYPY